MTLLVFGRTGQVAMELRALCPRAVFLGRDQADLSDPVACARAIRDHAPWGVINAAAWTAVDKAEAEETEAWVVNAKAPAAMAQVCSEMGIPLVHISTDYVFDGSGTAPWKPDSPVVPLGAYGRSKLAGELAVETSGAVAAILRTSWVFSAHGANFVKTMLRLGATRDSLAVVGDQVGGPTPASEIAAACLLLVQRLRDEPELAGTYHFSGAPDVSWADFAREIFAQANLPCQVTDIPTEAYPTPAQRPANSRLDCSSLTKTFGIQRPDWRVGLRDVLTALKGSQP